MFRFHLIVSFYFAVFQVDLRIFICPHICSIESFTFDHQVCKFGAPNWRLIQVWIQSSAYLSWSFMIFPLMFPLMFPIIPSISPHFPYISPTFSLHFPWFSHGKVAWPAGSPSASCSPGSTWAAPWDQCLEAPENSVNGKCFGWDYITLQ